MHTCRCTEKYGLDFVVFISSASILLHTLAVVDQSIHSEISSDFLNFSMDLNEHNVQNGDVQMSHWSEMRCGWSEVVLHTDLLSSVS